MLKTTICGWPRYGHKRHITKILLVMKLTAFLLTTVLLNVSAKVLSQSVTFSGKQTKLEQVFASVKEQTGYNFFYDAPLIEKAPGITISAMDMPLEEFLKKIFHDLPLKYSIQNKNVIVSRKAPEDVALYIAANVLYDTVKHVQGFVHDTTGRPLPAITVLIKGTKRGTVTDGSGRFSLRASSGEILVFSSILYETREMKVGDGNLDVLLMERVNKIKEVEVVSTDYFSTTKERSTMNITRVDGSVIAKQPVTTLLNSLIGLVPGLDISLSNGAPGAASSIEIRGRNSLNYTGSKPLFVVDGIQVDSKPLDSYGSTMYGPGYDPLAGINPADVESIEVLKDAAATAIYGTRGANGVIRITTKRAKYSGKGLFDFTLYRGFGKLPRKVDLLDSEEYMAMRHEAYANDGLVPSPNVPDMNGLWDTTRYTDWQEVLLGGTANITNIDGSYSAGNEYNSFRLGAGYHREDAIYPGDDFGLKRATTSFSFNHRSPNGRFQLQTGVAFGWIKTRSYNLQTGAATTLPPVAPKLYNDDGSLNWQMRDNNGRPQRTWDNPLASMERVQNSIANDLRVNATIGYEVIAGLQLKTMISHTQIDNDEHNVTPIKAYSPPYDYSTGTALFNNNKRKALTIDPQITYQKRIYDHGINAIVGGSWQKSNYIFRVVQGSDYPSDAFLGSIRGAKSLYYIEDDNFHYKYASLYARVGYDYKNRYMMDLTGRRDGSSRFGPGRRFGNFGAVSAGWIFSEEPWIKNKWLSYGKIRGSYGLTGNDQIEDYKYLDTYEIITFGYQGNVSVEPSALFNPDYRWEMTKKAEMALELGFIENRITIDVAWYNHLTSNQLVMSPLAYTTGFTDVTANFDAVVLNRGLEFFVTTKNITRKNFSWGTTFNIAFPKNKLVKFDDIESSHYAEVYKVGQPLNITKRYKYKGLNTETGLYEVYDLDGDGYIDQDDMVFTDPMGRKRSAGIQNMITYRNFDLWFTLFLSSNPASSFLPINAPGSITNQPRVVLDRWQKPGDQTRYMRFTTYGGDAYFYASVSDLDIMDASYIRLSSLSLSYRFGPAVLGKTGLREAKLFLQGQNLFTLSKFKLGYDPETVYSLPPTRMFTAGAQVKF